MDVDNSLFQTTAVYLQHPHSWLLGSVFCHQCQPGCSPLHCFRFHPVLCKALLSLKPHSECSPISPESSLLLSFASVGTNLFLIYPCFRFSYWEMNCYFFWVLFAFCHLMQDCLQGPAHSTIPKFLLSALRPHDQIFTLASTSVGSLLPQSESISILRTPTARSTPDTSNGFLERVLLLPMPSNGIFTSHRAVLLGVS